MSEVMCSCWALSDLTSHLPAGGFLLPSMVFYLNKIVLNYQMQFCILLCNHIVKILKKIIILILNMQVLYIISNKLISPNLSIYQWRCRLQSQTREREYWPKKIHPWLDEIWRLYLFTRGQCLVINSYTIQRSIVMV